MEPQLLEDLKEKVLGKPPIPPIGRSKPKTSWDLKSIRPAVMRSTDEGKSYIMSRHVGDFLPPEGINQYVKSPRLRMTKDKGTFMSHSELDAIYKSDLNRLTPDMTLGETTGYLQKNPYSARQAEDKTKIKNYSKPGWVSERSERDSRSDNKNNHHSFRLLNQREAEHWSHSTPKNQREKRFENLPKSDPKPKKQISTYRQNQNQKTPRRKDLKSSQTPIPTPRGRTLPETKDNLTTKNLQNSSRRSKSTSKALQLQPIPDKDLPTDTQRMERSSKRKPFQYNPLRKRYPRPATPFGDTKPVVDVRRVRIPQIDATPHKMGNTKRNLMNFRPPRVYEYSLLNFNSKRAALQNAVPETLLPLQNPTNALSLASRKILSKDVKEIQQGILMGVQLVRFHQQVLEENDKELGYFILLTLPLLSSTIPLIARTTAIFFKELIPLQLKSVQSNAETIVEKIILKSVDMNPMISEVCINALEDFIKYLPEGFGFWLVHGIGLCHKNLFVRKVAVRLLSLFIEKIGTESFVERYAKFALVSMVKILQEGSIEIRSKMQDIFRQLVPYVSMRYFISTEIPRNMHILVAKNLNALVDETEAKCKRDNLLWENDTEWLARQARSMYKP